MRIGIVTGDERSSKHGAGTDRHEGIGRGHACPPLLRAFAGPHGSSKRHEPGRVRQRPRVWAPFEKALIGHSALHGLATPCDAVLDDAHEAVGICERERLQQNRVHHAVDGGGGADAKTQGQHSDGREPFCPREAPRCVTEVLSDRFEPGEPCLFPERLPDLRHPTEPRACSATRFSRGHPPLDVLGGEQVEMQLDFAIGFPLEPAPDQHVPETRQKFTNPDPHRSPPHRQPKQPRHDPSDSLPISCFFDELSTTGSGDGVELGFSIVLRATPARGDPAPLSKTQQRGVDGAFVELQDVLADLLDAAGDAVAMQRSHDVQGLQHHQVKRALEHVCLRSSFGHDIGV